MGSVFGVIPINRKGRWCMAAGLESALKQMLREVLAEVASDFMQEWKATNRNPPSSAPADHNLLLTARETAKRLAISERHLHGLTKAGQIPSVRVGNAVRYNVETIRDWIRKAEATERPVRSKSSEPNQVSAKAERRRTPQRKTKVAERQERRGTGSKDASRSNQVKLKVPRPKVNDEPQVESEERISPLSVLLNELGIDRSSLPPLTNGDLMRFAEVDIATMHGWKYLGRSLPEEAMNKLTNQLRRLAEIGRDKK
jgi:excisionase family DNA binding protein